MRRIGVLLNTAADDPMGQARVAAFVQGLQAAGWSDGRNVRIDTRGAAADPDLASVKPLYLREADAHPQAAGVLPRQ